MVVSRTLSEAFNDVLVTHGSIEKAKDFYLLPHWIITMPFEVCVVDINVPDF